MMYVELWRNWNIRILGTWNLIPDLGPTCYRRTLLIISALVVLYGLINRYCFTPKPLSHIVKYTKTHFCYRSNVLSAHFINHFNSNGALLFDQSLGFCTLHPPSHNTDIAYSTATFSCALETLLQIAALCKSSRCILNHVRWRQLWTSKKSSMTRATICAMFRQPY